MWQCSQSTQPTDVDAIIPFHMTLSMGTQALPTVSQLSYETNEHTE